MIAVSTSSCDYPQVIAQEAKASFILEKPRAGYAALVLVARQAAGNEVRLPLAYATIIRLIDFISDCRESFAGRIAENDRDLVFLYEHGRFEIRRKEQSITMGLQSAYQMVEALQAFIA
jgi:hypothetical protein